MVTGISEGLVTISAKTSNGKIASISLIVKEAPVNYSSGGNGSTSSNTPVVGDGVTVYITEYGKKYHINSSCVQNPIPMNKNDAINWGYEPCEKCAQ